MEIARHVGVERNILRHPVKAESLEDVVILRLALHLLERLERLIYRSP